MRSGIVVLVALSFTAGSLGAQQHQRGAPPDSGSSLQMAHCVPGGTMSWMQRDMRPGEMHRDMAGGGMHMGMMSGMMQGQGMMRMPGGILMRRPMSFQADHILAYREELELQPEQVSQLEQLESARGAAHQAAVSAAREQWQKFQEAFDADPPDTAAVRTAAEQALGPHAAIHARMIADAAAVRAILTEAQREKAVTLPRCGQG